MATIGRNERKQIEKRLGDRARFQRAVIESVDALLAEAKTRQRPPVPEPAPEIVAEFQERHWHAWIDQPIPALKGQTPREASKTTEGAGSDSRRCWRSSSGAEEHPCSGCARS